MFTRIYPIGVHQNLQTIIFKRSTSTLHCEDCIHHRIDLNQYKMTSRKQTGNHLARADFPAVLQYPYPLCDLNGIEFGFFDTVVKETVSDTRKEGLLGGADQYSESLSGDDTRKVSANGKGDEKVSGRRRRRRNTLNTELILSVVRKFCDESELNLSEDGPFGKATKMLNWGNTYKNRKYLRRLLTSNPRTMIGNKNTKAEVCQAIKNDKMSPNTKKKRLSLKKNKTKHPLLKNGIPPNMNEGNCFDLKQDINHVAFNSNVDDTSTPVLKSSRKFRKRKIPFTPSTFQPVKPDSYCLCKVNYKSVDDGRMIECQGCRVWYHCTCLKVPQLPKDVSGKDIKFKCGKGKCNAGIFDLFIKGSRVVSHTNDQIVHPDNSSETVESFEKIESIEKDASKIFNLVDAFNGSESDYNYKYLNERLTRILLMLDGVKVYGKSEIRSKRKNAVDTVYSYIEKLDNKVEKNSTRNHIKKDEDSTDSSKLSCHDIHDDDIPSPRNTPEGNTYFENEIIDSIPSKAQMHGDEKGHSDLNHNTTLTDDEKNANGFGNTDEHAANKCPLDKGTIENVLHCSIPQRYFEAEVPSSASFNISADGIEHLNRVKNGRMYKKGQWQHIFIEGMSESNKQCVFMFDRHQISSAKRRSKRKNVPYFKADAHCKFSNCTITAKVTMWELGVADVAYRGQMKHEISDEYARPIRGKERDDLKANFQLGSKPLKHFLKAFNDKDPEQLVSGNLNGVGKDTHVYRQISSESKQVGRLDNDLLTSLLKAMENQRENGSQFIQKISAKPFHILYWSEEGLSIYHKMAPQEGIFWDATGSVVRKAEDGKHFLYYEIAVRHPVKGKMGIPVCSMISEDQSLPSLLDWIARFRHAEKKVFGHGNLCQPKIIISDEAWVFILAALKEFNTETLQDFLDRSWKIALGNLHPSDSSKSIIHLCTSHFMNKVKMFCKNNYKRNMRMGIYMVSLLLNSKSLAEAEEILHDIIVTLKAQTICPESEMYINRLIFKINSFDTSVMDLAENVGDDTMKDNELSLSKPGFYTEEDFLNLAGFSPFKRWGKNIENQISFERIQTGPKNPYHSDVFLNQILNKYIPIFPLWGSILLQKLQPESTSSSTFNENSTCRTQATIENRFRILKYIGLDGKRNSRLDDFSENLREHTITVQKLAAKDALKSKHRLKRKRSTSTVKENWNKKQKPNENISSNIGVFQKGPSNLIKSPQKSESPPESTLQGHGICPIENLGATCWFNATMQAIFQSNMSKLLSEFYESRPINIDKNQWDITKSSLVEIIKFMIQNCKEGKEVPKQLVLGALHDMSTFGDGFGKSFGQQQDANEFYVKYISKLAEEINEKLYIDQIFTCIDCGNTKSLKECHTQCLSLNILNKPTVRMTMLELLKDYFDRDIREKCEKCGGLLDLKQVLNKIPQTLVLCVKRFSFDILRNVAQKIRTPISVDRELNLKLFGILNQTSTYKLKSVVCHHGRSPNSGHYTNFIPSQKQLITVSDAKVSIGQEHDMECNCYILFYDRVEVTLPDYANVLLHCLSNSKGMSMSDSDPRSCKSSSTKRVLRHHVRTGDLDKETLSVIAKTIACCSDYKEINNASQFTQYLLEGLYRFNCTEDEKNVGTECFETVVDKVMKCSSCQISRIQTSQRRSILQPDYLTEEGISNCFKVPLLYCKDCYEKDSVTCMTYISWLPYSLIVSAETNSNVQDEHVVCKFDLSAYTNTSIPLVSTEYHLVSMLVKRDGIFSQIKIKGGDFHWFDKDGESQLISQNAVSQFEKILLFYDLQTKSARLPFLPKAVPAVQDLPFLYVQGKCLKNVIFKILQAEFKRSSQ